MERRINIINKRRKTSKTNDISLLDMSNSWLFRIFAIGVSGVLLFSVYNSANITLQKEEILRKAEQEVEDLRLTNLHLSIEIKEMSTDKYLEKEARDRLNFGGKNEIVFVIPENALNSAREKVEQLTNPPKATVYDNGNNLGEWVDFVLLGI